MTNTMTLDPFAAITLKKKNGVRERVEDDVMYNMYWYSSVVDKPW